MDMSVIQSSMLSNLASLQSAISTTMMDKSMNMASSEAASLLEDLPAAAPAPAAPSFGHKLDTYA